MKHATDRLRITVFATLLAVAPIASAGLNHSHNDDESENSAQVRDEARTSVRWRDWRANKPHTWVQFQILAINDFHGQINGRVSANRPIGGAAVLASYLKAAQEEMEDGKTFIVHAGDHVGASPPASALLQDEPSISFLNLLANKHCSYRHPLHPGCNVVGTLGNHEFDDGVAEMLRLVNGGNHANGPFLEEHYRGARFPYVCANVVDANSGKPVLPPYVIKHVRGIPVAFIGAVLKETPAIVTPTGVAGVNFLDEAYAINSYIPKLKAKGVRAIIVLIHQGVGVTPFAGQTPTAPMELPGQIGDIVKRLDKEVDIVVSGHAHGFTNTLVPNQDGKLILVTQAFSASTAYADINVAIDPVTRDIVEKSAAVYSTWADEGPGLSPDPDVAALVAAAEQRVAPLVNRVVGTAAIPITRTLSTAGEAALGNLVADGMRRTMNTQFAFMQPGGIRTDLNAGEITWGELFAIQPFSNDLVRMDLTGAQIVTLLNQQWVNQPFPRPLQISGLTYMWDNARPVGDRIVEVRDASNGHALDPAVSYSVTVNSFTAAGGDGFTVLKQGTNREVGPVDVDALVAYITSLPQPVSASIEGRVQRIN